MTSKKENTAPTPAISTTGSGQGSMTHEQFEREKKYQAAVAVARSMLDDDVIDEADFRIIEACLNEKFNPVLGGIMY